jgi:hypothetical protein
MAADGDLDAVAAVREAEHLFYEQRLRGATAVRVALHGERVYIDTFDPAADEIILLPRIVGG